MRPYQPRGTQKTSVVSILIALRQANHRISYPNNIGDLSLLTHFAFAVAGMSVKRPRGGELTKLVPDHVLRDVDGDELLAVVDGKRQAHSIGSDGRTPRPGLDYLFTFVLDGIIDFFAQMLVDERSLFNGSTHCLPFFLLGAPFHDELVA